MPAVHTRPDQAMPFRLPGDRNPLHIDPAAAAGFPRPILHGACTCAVACATLLREVCALDPARLKALRARFVAPLFPGETLEMALWSLPEGAAFRLSAPGRGAVILDGGLARLDVA
jgi:acyl dehydratase